MSTRTLDNIFMYRSPVGEKLIASSKLTFIIVSPIKDPTVDRINELARELCHTCIKQSRTLNLM